MILFYHPLCVDDGFSLRPEQPGRITHSMRRPKETHGNRSWDKAGEADEADSLHAHEPSLLKRLHQAPNPPRLIDDILSAWENRTLLPV